MFRAATVLCMKNSTCFANASQTSSYEVNRRGSPVCGPICSPVRREAPSLSASSRIMGPLIWPAVISRECEGTPGVKQPAST